jgi:Ca-activated chloride channel family protein
MARRLVLGIAVWLLLARTILADGDIKAELAQIDTSKYPDVTLYISVRDDKDQLVEGLTQGEFEIVEDGVPVEVITFTAGIRSAITTVMSIDRSGSMNFENKFTGAKTAAKTFVDLMRDQDQAALVAFADKAVTMQDFTSDRGLLKEKIDRLEMGECTAWYDGVYHSVDLIASREGRRSIILVTDGIDCREDWLRYMAGYGSTHTMEEAIAHASQADLPIHAIGVGQAATAEVSNEGFDEAKLKRVASETGGKFFHAPTADQLKQLYESLSVEMQKEYVVTYHSPRPTYDGTRRDIQITIQRGGGAPAVRASGRYLEQHLIHIRSDLRLFLGLLSPLLLLLLAPMLPATLKRHQATRRSLAPAQPIPPVQPPRTQAQFTGTSVAPRAGNQLANPNRAAVPPSHTDSGGRGHPSQPSSMGAPPIVSLPGLAAPQVQSSPANLSVQAQAGPRLIARFPLPPGGLSIGRAPDNTIILNHPSVAPHHAQIMVQGPRYVIRDLSNGRTFVSFRGAADQERPVGENALRDGSIIRLGEVCTYLHLQDGHSGGYIEVPFAIQQSATLGRDLANTVVLNMPEMAPHQAEVRQEEGRFVVYNLASGAQNLFVSYNGEASQERPLEQRNALKAGSTLRMGTMIFKLEL